MGKFRRELRYLVFKLKDIDRYLSPREWETLVSIENKIIAARDKERRPQLSTVVVERDWPEFETVWGMIEARMLGVKNKYEVEIEEIQAELSEQCRLLGMSAERELKLIAERDQFRDGMLTLGTELRTIEDALDDERINLTHTAAQVAAEMRGKINELHAQIQRLITERNAFGLAIDRALAGIVPDEHPLRSRLVEIAAMRAQPAPRVPDDADAHDPSTAAIEYALKADEGLDFLYYWFHGDFDVIRREWSDAPEEVFIGADPLYRVPASQESNDERT